MPADPGTVADTMIINPTAEDTMIRNNTALTSLNADLNTMVINKNDSDDNTAKRKKSFVFSIADLSITAYNCGFCFIIIPAN